MNELRVSLRKLLKITVFVLLTAYLLVCTFLLYSNGTAEFGKASEMLQVMPMLALVALCAVVLWMELDAIGKWIKAAKEKRNNYEVLSTKQTITLIILLAAIVALAILLAFVYDIDMKAKTIAILVLLPTPESIYGILLWIGVIVLIKQFIAHRVAR